MGYLVNLISNGGYDIGNWDCDNLAQAKEKARYVLSDAWAANVGTSHAANDTWKVEIIRARDDVCVWDKFYEAC